MPTSAWERARPAIDADAARALLTDIYGLDGRLDELGSQQDRNYLVAQSDGTKCVLKVDHPATTPEQLAAQELAIGQVAAAGLEVPQLLLSREGRTATQLTDGPAQGGHVRLMTYLAGGTLAEHGSFGELEARVLGEAAGRVVAALAELEHPGFTHEIQWDLRRGLEVAAELIDDVRDEAHRATISEAMTMVSPVLEDVAGQLPVQPIHGDLTDDNVFGTDTGPGIIDFGDVGDGWRIAELAVAIASVLQRTGSFAHAVAALDEYARHRDVTDAELHALWPLVILRGAVLVVSGENQLRIDEGNEYASARMDSEWRVLETALATPLEVAEAQFRLALGRPHRAGLEYAPVFVGVERMRVVALNAEAPVFDRGAWLASGTVDRELEASLDAAELVATRYAEWRLDVASAPAPEAPENCALFVEIIAATSATVFAPFAGVVDVLDAETIDLSDGVVRARFRGVHGAVAGSVAAGDALGALATEIDGTPRVRIQLINGRDDATIDWASTDNAGERAALRPDPSALLGIAAAPSPVRQLRQERRRRALALGRASERFWDEPPVIVRGWGSYLIDHTARPLLDLVNNVAELGHSHPRITEVAARALETLNTNSRFLYGAYADFAERLVERANRAWPGEFDVAVPVNSGSEAVDLALRMAKVFTKRRGVIVPREAYHGWTLASDAISTSTFDNPAAEDSRPDWVHLVEAPNAYRGSHRGEGAADGYLTEIERLLGNAPEPIAAFITESVLGNAGGVIPPEGYLRRAFAAIREHGGVAIADEVQVGYGRLGSHFWGAELAGARPDIITVAKAAGNGFPLGAVITRREVLDALADEGMFFSSAAGSPLSSAVGAAVLDLVDEERVIERAARVGTRFTDLMRELQARHAWIGEVHGSGLYQGVELVRDRDTREPATEETARLCERMLRHGMIVQPASERQNVLKFKPPTTITEFDVEAFAQALDVELARLG
jgi:4-aminobutyrate aminotransferase-like enzyme/Ser/Thr protein kinase RdoA (MazF antagonist)